MSQLYIIGLLLVWILVLFNLFLTIGLINRVKKINETLNFGNVEFLLPGQQAPDFITSNLNNTELVTLSTYNQQAKLFVFISPTCEPCIEKLPSFQTIAVNAKKKGIEFVLISISDDHAETENLINAYAIDVPVVVTSYGSKFLEDYKIIGTPAYYFIDNNDKVLSSGFLDSNLDEVIQTWF